MVSLKFLFRSVSTVKGYSNRYINALDIIFHIFTTVKCFVTEINGLGNSQKTDQVNAWKNNLILDQSLHSPENVHFLK